MIDLPQKTKDGKPYLSFSQYKLWRDSESFNLKVKGRLEYMVQYFLGYKFPDEGWAEFGHDVEDYVTLREGAEKFKPKELETMEKIETLGEFQKEFELDLGEFVVIGFIDDIQQDYKRVRDYKTASKNSKDKYLLEDYYQLDLYAMWVHSVIGILPEIEVCVIERKGNCMYGKGRKALTVGDNIWHFPRETNVDRISWLRDDITKAAHEISEAYKAFKILND